MRTVCDNFATAEYQNTNTLLSTYGGGADFPREIKKNPVDEKVSVDVRQEKWCIELQNPGENADCKLVGGRGEMCHEENFFRGSDFLGVRNTQLLAKQRNAEKSNFQKVESELENNIE